MSDINVQPKSIRVLMSAQNSSDSAKEKIGTEKKNERDNTDTHAHTSVEVWHSPLGRYPTSGSKSSEKKT